MPIEKISPQYYLAKSQVGFLVRSANEQDGLVAEAVVLDPDASNHVVSSFILKIKFFSDC